MNSHIKSARIEGLMINSLYYVSYAEFQRVLGMNLSAVKKTRIFATLARINTLYMIAKAGSGHLGSSFSSIDIFSWLYLSTMKEEDIFFSSKGHDVPGLYAVLIGQGYLDYENIHKLRRLGGLPGHPDIDTPYIVTNTGSLGMGISKAKGMVFANQLDGKESRIYVLTGDGELQEGQVWESLPGAVNRGMDKITVIVDHNKIQSDTWVENVNDLGDLEAKFASFGWYVQRCNGNSLEELESALNTAKAVKGKPQVIIADTIKGYGVSFMEATSLPKDKELYHFHSGALSNKNYERAAKELIGKANALLTELDKQVLAIETVDCPAPASPQGNVQKLIPAYEKALFDIGGRRQDIVVLDADLMIDCGLLSFRNAYPERFIECGIAEQDMVSQAGALALHEKLPLSHSFACFIATRANEQIFNNASERTKCIYVGSLAGILPSGPGHSHQMVRDISALGGIPSLTLVEPSCEAEVDMVVNYAVEKNPKSTYVRLVSSPYEVPFVLPDGYELQEGKGVALTEGKDAILFSYGPIMLSEGYKAAEILKSKHKFGLKVVNLPWLNMVDGDWLKSIIGDIKNVYTMDNHLLDGGQGERIGTTIAEVGLTGDVLFTRLGLGELPVCGCNDEVLKHYGLDADSIAGVVKHL